MLPVDSSGSWHRSRSVLRAQNAACIAHSEQSLHMKRSLLQVDLVRSGLGDADEDRNGIHDYSPCIPFVLQEQCHKGTVIAQMHSSPDFPWVYRRKPLQPKLPHTASLGVPHMLAAVTGVSLRLW